MEIEELLTRVREWKNDTTWDKAVEKEGVAARNAILLRLMPVIRKSIVKHIGYITDDVFQEGVILAIEAIEEYVPDKRISLEIYIDRKMKELRTRINKDDFIYSNGRKSRRRRGYSNHHKERTL